MFPSELCVVKIELHILRDSFLLFITLKVFEKVFLFVISKTQSNARGFTLASIRSSKALHWFVAKFATNQCKALIASSLSAKSAYCRYDKTSFIVSQTFLFPLLQRQRMADSVEKLEWHYPPTLYCWTYTNHTTGFVLVLSAYHDTVQLLVRYLFSESIS